MKSVGIAILGFGTVGGGTYNILAERKERIKEEYGVDITVKAIYVRNPKKAIANGAPQELVTSNFDDIITNSAIDIVAECIGGIEPAKTFLIESLKAGKNIVTANKELFAKHWGELEKYAQETKAGMYFEATCGGGKDFDSSYASKYFTSNKRYHKRHNKLHFVKNVRRGCQLRRCLGRCSSIRLCRSRPYSRCGRF